MNTSTSPRIAIIGGGAAGLAVARVLSRAGLLPTVFEQDDTIGGVWNYNQDNSHVKPMYRHLRTNLPKEIMAYRELPFPPTSMSKSYVTHQDVKDYLQYYISQFDLRQYLHMNCRVQQLTIVSDDTKSSNLSPTFESWPQIQLEWTQNNNDDKKQFSETFDAVCVCNGHYGIPSIPEIPGIQHFQGQTMHSISYDNPMDFCNQTVLCIGGRASGSDVAREISQYAKHVYLSDSVAPPLGENGMPMSKHNVTWVPRTTHVLEDGSIGFGQGECAITPKVDTIIYCTGYDYSFPFINERSHLELDTRGRRVMPLYQQLWHAQFPNLAFVGLPHSVVPFPLFELQAEACHEQWKKWTLADGAGRMEAARRDAESGGEGKENNQGRVPQDTHYLGNAQWDYSRRMAKYAGVYNQELENYIATNKAIYDHSGAQRKGAFPGAKDDYRETVYERNDKDQSYKVVSSIVEETNKKETMAEAE